MDHVDNKGIIDGLWKREMKCSGPKAKDADLWIALWEELNKLRSKGHFGRGRSMSRRIALRRKSSNSRSAKSLSLRAMRKRMSWQRKERCWMEVLWRRQEQALSSKKEMKCTQPCSTQPVFIAWWKNGKIAKNLSLSQERSGSSWNRKRRKRSIKRSGASQQTSIVRCGRCKDNVQDQNG